MWNNYITLRKKFSKIYSLMFTNYRIFVSTSFLLYFNYPIIYSTITCFVLAHLSSLNEKIVYTLVKLYTLQLKCVALQSVINDM